MSESVYTEVYDISVFLRSQCKCVFMCVCTCLCCKMLLHVIPVDVSNVQSKAGCVHCHEDGGIGIWES